MFQMKVKITQEIISRIMPQAKTMVRAFIMETFEAETINIHKEGSVITITEGTMTKVNITNKILPI